MTTTLDGGVGILGTGSYVPERIVTNAELATFVRDADPDWAVRKTLIEERRYAADDEATSDLAAKAAKRALTNARVSPDRVDYLIVSTSTGDSPRPPTSSLVQRAIEAKNAACFDMNVVCAGFVYALEMARSLVAANPGAVVLVVAADIYSRILDFNDRRTSVLFGDGAGAAVIGAVPHPYGIIGVELISNGDAHDLIYVEAGGSRRPASAETIADGGHWFRMNGRAVQDFVLEGVPPVLDRLLKRTHLTAYDVQHFVPHQANGMMLRELAAAAGLQKALKHTVLDRYGNTGSASIAVTLDEAARSKDLKDQDLVLLAGFGGGMAIGVLLIRHWRQPWA